MIFLKTEKIVKTVRKKSKNTNTNIQIRIHRRPPTPILILNLTKPTTPAKSIQQTISLIKIINLFLDSWTIQHDILYLSCCKKVKYANSDLMQEKKQTVKFKAVLLAAWLFINFMIDLQKLMSTLCPECYKYDIFYE